MSSRQNIEYSFNIYRQYREPNGSFRVDAVEWSKMDYDTFTDELKRELDVCDYHPSEDNIKVNNPGLFDGVSKKCMKRIVDYYLFRNNLFGEIVQEFGDLTRRGLMGIKGRSANSFSRTYEIPMEKDSFDIDDPNFDSGLVEGWIGVTAKLVLDDNNNNDDKKKKKTQKRKSKV